MPNIITSQLARNKTKDNIKLLDTINLRQTNRLNELNSQAQQRYDNSLNQSLNKPINKPIK